MQNKFNWLDTSEVCEINERTVSASNEPYNLLDMAKLEGALMRPYNNWLYQDEENVVVLSVEYMFSVAQAHAFIQGNKRTGVLTGRLFMQRHGYDVIMPDDEETAKLFKAAIAHEADCSRFYTHIEMHTVLLDE